jgi:hypothetical protein
MGSGIELEKIRIRWGRHSALHSTITKKIKAEVTKKEEKII